MLSQRIEEDFKGAMKAKDTIKRETIRMLKAAVKNYLIEKRKDQIEDAELIGLIQKQVKLREDSIDSFKKGGRSDLVEKETREKTILEAYLPKQLSDAELKALVQKAIQQAGAKTKADMGKVMKEAVALAGGKADGKRINQIVVSLLV